MRGRILPGLFWIGVLLSSVLMTTRLQASLPSTRFPNLLGHWDGFVFEVSQGPAVGLIQSDVTGQNQRVIAGQGEVFGLDGQTLLDSYGFRASLETNNTILGNGEDSTGSLAIRGGISLYAGLQGNAAIWDPDFISWPRRGRPNRFRATLLHPFSDLYAPNIGSHSIQGFFRGMTDPAFSGTASMQVMPLQRGSFPGTFTFTPASNSQSGFSWPIRITTSGSSQFVMIGQGKTGKMSYVGSVITKNGTPTELWGIAKLSLIDGRILYNTYNASLRALSP
jgi:hypothetical protein